MTRDYLSTTELSAHSFPHFSFTVLFSGPKLSSVCLLGSHVLLQSLFEVFFIILFMSSFYASVCLYRSTVGDR